MAMHARLKNEYMEDEKYHNLITWFIYTCYQFPLASYTVEREVIVTLFTSCIVGNIGLWDEYHMV